MSIKDHILKIAHEFEHDLTFLKKYSEVKIYDAKGDIAKRWYVYFSYRNPATGKMVRQDNIYIGLNNFKNVKDRRSAAKILKRSVESLLRNGYDPYAESEPVHEIPKLNIPQAVEFVLEIKKKEYGSGYTDYKSRLKQFEKWLLENGFENRLIDKVNKTAVIKYLNFVLQKNSPSNRNNTRSALSVFFDVLLQNELVQENFISKINVLKAKPERNKSYTSTQEKKIFEMLEANDPLLSLYIKFVSYNFLRPIEVNRLKVKDIDIVDKKMYVRAKNKDVKIKIIPDILIEQLPDLTKLHPELILFGMSTIGEKWETELENRRGFYSKRFRKVIKEKLKLGVEYGLYSFRHTFISNLYNALLIDSTPHVAKGKLMLITGHTTINALDKYLRDIDAVLPEDYSHLIK